MKIQIDPDLHRKLTAILKAGGIPDAELEAQWILEDIPDADDALDIARKRAEHQPLQYLLGAWEFYGLPIRVGKGVLIPRADTETLVDAALERLRHISAPKIADLCTGSGCIALALKSQRPDADICGVEKSDAAMAYARKNAESLRMNVSVFAGDVLDAQTAERFAGLDAIVCNPPYLTADDMQQLQEEVRYEPTAALDGGQDGLLFYREITRLWQHALKNGAWLCYEVGIGQADDVAGILAGYAFGDIRKLRDLNGVERVVCGKKDIPDISVLNN